MLPPINHHTFETRIVHSKDGFSFYQLSKDIDGNLYFVSKVPMQLTLMKLSDFGRLLESLQKAFTSPVVEIEDIKNISN